MKRWREEVKRGGHEKQTLERERERERENETGHTRTHKVKI